MKIPRRAQEKVCGSRMYLSLGNVNLLNKSKIIRQGG
jgi:hypothetical protein